LSEQEAVQREVEPGVVLHSPARSTRSAAAAAAAARLGPLPLDTLLAKLRS